MGWVISIWLDSNVANLKVFRTDVAQFFQPSIDCIVKAVLEQKSSAHKTISVSLYTTLFGYHYANHFLYFQHVVLVGGFAASNWLFSKVHELLTPVGLNVVRPENHVWVFFMIESTLLLKKYLFRNKAVSDGAISFYLDHFVKTRVSKVTYGSFCHIPYDPRAPDHILRSHNVFIGVSGAERITNFFDIILPKVSCLNLFRQMYVN